MKTIKDICCLLCLLSLSMLMSCGDTSQDDGSAAAAANIDGAAIDGHLARATVYIDTNDNVIIDAWEPHALTDNDGYFTEGINGEDYCADSTADDYRYCLTTGIDREDALLRITGGYDVLTEEAFSGTMTTTVDLVAGQNIADTLVTPLTTLVAGASTSEERATILQSLGITESDLTVDYLDDSGTNGIDEELLNAAFTVHKVISVLCDLIDEQYTQMGEDEDLPDDSCAEVYDAMSDYIVDNATGSEQDFDQLVDSTAEIETILEAAETNVRALYTEESITQPVALVGGGSTAIDAVVDQTALRVTQIVTTVNDLFPIDEDISLTVATGEARALDAIVGRIEDEINPAVALTADDDIDLIMDLATDTANASYDTFYTNLRQDNFDIGTLISQDFTDAADVASNASLPSDAATFSNIAGKRLLVNDPDNLDTSRRKHARLELYFEADSTTATEGTLAACVKYLEGTAAASTANINSLDETLMEDSNTYGDYVTGDWSVLGSGYSMIVVLQVAGFDYQAILKSAGTNDNDRYVYRFDFDEGLEDWTSLNGIVSQEDTDPITDDECKQRFVSVSE